MIMRDQVRSRIPVPGLVGLAAFALLALPGSSWVQEPKTQGSKPANSATDQLKLTEGHLDHFDGQVETKFILVDDRKSESSDTTT